MSVACNTCGNPVGNDAFICPYCESYDIAVDTKNIRVRRVDIGHGGQSVKQARTQLAKEVGISRKRGDDFLILIHGHGSTGTGGDIGKMIRREAHQHRQRGLISMFVAGEDLEEACSSTTRALRHHPSLRELKEWNQGNRGVTIFLISS